MLFRHMLTPQTLCPEPHRFCQMMWRLNFLVFFCCVVLQNSYMLYYICPMHTIFTIMVYASLAILPQYNKNAVFMWCKCVRDVMQGSGFIP